MEIISGEWGRAKTFMLPFVTYGATDFLAGVTLAEGDAKISKNGTAFEDLATLPTILGKWMIITLSAAEMQAEYIAIEVIDQTATKVFEDTGAILATSPRAWIQAIFSLIESQRGSHTGKGQLIFWDPMATDDTGSGLVFHEPKKTYNFNGAGGVHSLMTDNSHDIIIALPNPGGGPTEVNEYFENDKAYNFFRGPGRDWLFKATHNESCAVLLSAEGCELSGCRVETKTTGSQDAICASGDFARIHKAWVDYSRGSGIKIDNASSCELEDFIIQDSAQGGSGHALHILGDTSLTTRNIIGSGEIFENGNGGGGADGIRVDGVNCQHNFIHGGSHALLIHDNTGWGIQNVNGATHTIIVGPTVHVGHNDLGDVNVDVTSVAENIEPWATAEELAKIPITDPVNIISTTGYVKDINWASGGKFFIKESEDISVPFWFEGNTTGLDLWFVVGRDLKEAPLFKKKLIEGTDWDVILEDDVYKVEGLLPFIYADTDALHGEYTAAVIVKIAENKSYTAWESTLVVSRPVAKAGLLV